GLVSFVTISSVWRSVAAALSLGSLARSGSTLSSAPKSRNWTPGKRCSARSAPLSTMRGAWSPPMASSAILIRWLTPRVPGAAPSGALGRRHDLATVVMAAMPAKAVRALQLAAIGALVVGRRRESVMGTAHVAARLRYFLLGNSHFWELA